jgi:hypothetical protein
MTSKHIKILSIIAIMGLSAHAGNAIQSFLEWSPTQTLINFAEKSSIPIVEKSNCISMQSSLNDMFQEANYNISLNVNAVSRAANDCCIKSAIRESRQTAMLAYRQYDKIAETIENWNDIGCPRYNDLEHQLEKSLRKYERNLRKVRELY